MIYRALLFVFGLLPERLQEVAEWLVSTKTTAGVAVVAVDASGRLMLFRHRYHPHGSWRLPGGHAHLGEPPEDALLRELEEEGGAVVEPGGVVHVSVSKRWPARMTIYYSARLVSPPQRTTAEVEGWRLFPLGELPPGLPAEQREAVRRATGSQRPSSRS